MGLIDDEAGPKSLRRPPATICLIDIEGFALLTLAMSFRHLFELLFLLSPTAHPMHTEELL